MVHSATSTWNVTTASGNWLTAGNWSGGVPGTSDIGLFNGTNPTDGNVGFSAVTSFGAISMSSTASTLTFGSIGTGGSRGVTLNGTTVNSVANTILANTTSSATTLTLVSRISGNKDITLTLGNTTNVIQASSGNTISIQLAIGETTANSTVTLQSGGKLILGAANTYTGLTTVSAGTIEYGISNAIRTGAVTVDGATAILSMLTFTDSVGTVTVDNGGSITGGSGGTLTSTGGFEMKSGSASAILAGAVALNKTTAGTITLTGTNTYTGSTTISAGTLNANKSSALGDETNANNTLIFSGGILQAGGTITSTSSRKVTLSSSGTIDTNSNTVSIAGIMSGTGGLTKSGTGTLTLTGTNTYTGTTTISAGTLQIGNAGTTGSLSTSSAITNNATLAFNRTDTVTQGTQFATVISGTGSVTQAGSGTLVLNGTNTYTGATAVNAGTLQVGVAGVGSLASGSAVTATSSTFTTPTTGAGVNANNVAVSSQKVVTGAPVIAGTGSILGNLTIGASSSSVGVIKPGDLSGSSNGTLNIGGNLVVNNGSQLQMGLTSSTKNDAAFNWYVPTGGSTALDYLTSGGVTDVTSGNFTTYWDTVGGSYDSINVTGTLSLGTGGTDYPTVLLSDNVFTYNKGDIFKLLDWSGIAYQTAGTIGGTRSLPGDLVLPGLAAGYSWDTTAFSSFGVVVVIPEPGRMMLLFFGLSALFMRRRRNR